MGKVPEPHASPKAPEEREWEWHAPAGSRTTDAILGSGGWELLAQAHAWYDPAADEEGHDPPHERGADTLPHHEIVDDRLRVVWNGVRSAMQVLMGARGGVDIREGDRKDVDLHLARHDQQFDREPPPF